MDAQTHCPICRRPLPDDARFCPLCGTSLQDGQERQVAPATGLLPAQHRLHGRYVIERKLAQGGQSAVYLAADLASGGARRAVKEMSQAHLLPAERERAINHFVREAQMLAQLAHPSLAKVHEYFVEEDKHYLAMEYVPGHTLEDEMIELGRPLEWEPVIRWGIVLCDVLTYLHAQQPPIVYRDLKPANVMLTPRGDLKLIDFGIARRLLPARTRDTAQLGTDGYAPLEQYASHSEPRSDLYALGASLYHLLTGRVPENAPMRSTGNALVAIHTISPQVPAAVEQVVMRALQIQPEDRFPTADALRFALAQLLQPDPSRAAEATPDRRPQPTGGARATLGPPKSVARTTAAPVGPKLHIWPLRLDAGHLDAGAAIVLELEVGNRGGGELAGHAETNMPGMSVDPAAVDGATAALHVRVDTAGFVPGSHVGHLAIRTNGGDQIVPVRFVVQAPAGAHLGQMARGRLPRTR